MAKHATIDKDGRAWIFMPGHPLNEGRRTQVSRARLIMWEVIGAFDLSYVVHHKDENKGNDELDNLELMSFIQHRRHHNLGNCWGRGNAGKERTLATRLKIRLAKVGKPYKGTRHWLGKTMPDDLREKFSQAHIGVPHPHFCSLCGKPKSNRRTHAKHLVKSAPFPAEQAA